MRFAIYSRKSVFTGRGESVENQVELCRRYILSSFPAAGEGDITVYEDEGFSGKDLNRPQFRRMMADLRRSPPDCVVCYRLDRISRNVGDFARLIEGLNRRGVALVCIREKFDTSTPMGKAMMYIASVFAQLEREDPGGAGAGQHAPAGRVGALAGGHAAHGLPLGAGAGADPGRADQDLLPPAGGARRAGRRPRRLPGHAGGAHPPGGVPPAGGRGGRGPDGPPLHPAGAALPSGESRLLRRRRDAWDYFASRGAQLCAPREAWDGTRGLLAYNKRDCAGGRAPRNPVEKWIVAAGRHPALIPGERWVAVQRLLDGGGPRPAVHNDRALLSRAAALRPVRRADVRQAAHRGGADGGGVRLYLPEQAAPRRRPLRRAEPPRRGHRPGGVGRPAPLAGPGAGGRRLPPPRPGAAAAAGAGGGVPPARRAGPAPLRRRSCRPWPSPWPGRGSSSPASPRRSGGHWSAC